ncbi:MAG: VOC family protein [Pseudomonadota bacterium]
MPHLKFDHIVIAARNLDEGCAYIKERLGIDMPPGGRHPSLGTHNRLLALGTDRFLEVISIDPDATAPGRARWFNLDKFDTAPRLITWMLNTDDIEASLATAHPDSGPATEVTRGTLKWLLSIPEDGSLPMGGAFPSIIQWSSHPHPAGGMVDLGCRLVKLTVEHPEAEEITRRIGADLQDLPVNIQTGPETRLQALIQTPDGPRDLL